MKGINAVLRLNPLTPLLLLSCRLDLHGRWDKPFRCRFDREGSRLTGLGPDDDEAQPVISLALGRLERLKTGCIAVIHGNNLTGTRYRKLDQIL